MDIGARILLAFLVPQVRQQDDVRARVWQSFAFYLFIFLIGAF